MVEFEHGPVRSSDGVGFEFCRVVRVFYRTVRGFYGVVEKLYRAVREFCGVDFRFYGVVKRFCGRRYRGYPPLSPHPRRLFGQRIG